MTTAESIVDQMYQGDTFSQWLGIKVEEAGPGHCRLRMRVRPEMLNGFGIAHGGIAYSLADSALAFAANGNGQHALSIETSISHTAPITEGTELIALASEEQLSPRIGIYRVEVRGTDGKLVALFKGTVYRKREAWELES